MDKKTIKQAEKIANSCKETRYEEHHAWGDGELEYLEVTDYRNCYNSAIKMAEWKEKELIDKAIEFLEPKILAFLSGDKVDTEKFIEEFKKTITDD